MKLFFAKSFWANEYVFAIKVRNKATDASQESEVWVASKDSSDNASKKDVTAKIQEEDLIENGATKIKGFTKSKIFFKH